MTFNPAAVDLPSFSALRLGIRTDRAGAALPQTAAGALFDITVGRIAVFGIQGQVTTAIQNQANNTKLKSVPTTGPTTDLCAVLDIANKALGTLLGIDGVATDALIAGGYAPLCQRPIIIPVGSISLDCAASNTGAISWSLFWLPIDDGATVAAH